MTSDVLGAAASSAGAGPALWIALVAPLVALVGVLVSSWWNGRSMIKAEDRRHANTLQAEGRRHELSLEAEQERHRLSLEAEAVRHENNMRRLAQERLLAEPRALYIPLDSALDQVARAASRLYWDSKGASRETLELQVSRLREGSFALVDEVKALGPAIDDAVDRAADKVERAIFKAMMPFRADVRLMSGEEHPVPDRAAFVELSRRIDNMRRAIREVGSPPSGRAGAPPSGPAGDV